MFSLPLAFFRFVLVIFLLETSVYLFVTFTFLFSSRNFSFFVSSLCDLCASTLFQVSRLRGKV